MSRRLRIEARVSAELAELAGRLARERKLLTPTGDPNISQLLRVLLIEERDRTNTQPPNEDP